MQTRPSLILRAGKPHWYIKVPASYGERGYYISTKTENREEAQKIYDDSGIEARVLEQRSGALRQAFMARYNDGMRITVSKAKEDYLAAIALRGMAPVTISGVSITLEKWIREGKISLSPIAMVSEQHVAKYINDPDSPITYSTRNYRLKWVGAFLEFCLESTWLPINPARNIHVRTAGLTHDQLVSKKKIPFTDEEIAALLAFIPKDDFWYGSVLLGKYFGLRLSTIASLEWNSIKEYRRMTIFTQKGRIVVDQELPLEFANWLRGWPIKGETGYVFPEQAARVLDISNAWLSAQFTRMCKKIGIRGKSFHCLRVAVVTKEFNAVLAQLGGRESAVMTALMARHGLNEVQRLIGHAQGSGVTLDRYFTPQSGGQSPPG